MHRLTAYVYEASAISEAADYMGIKLEIEDGSANTSVNIPAKSVLGMVIK